MSNSVVKSNVTLADIADRLEENSKVDDRKRTGRPFIVRKEENKAAVKIDFFSNDLRT